MQLKTLTLGLFLSFAHILVEGKSFLSALPIFQVKASDYVGTWVGYTANGSEFKIVLREQKRFKLANGYFCDAVVGKHSYINKERVIVNESLSGEKDDFVLFGMPEFNNPNEVNMSFDDRVHHKIVNVTLSFVGGNAKSLHWLFKSENETITINSKEKPLRGISVPTDLILKKVD